MARAAGIRAVVTGTEQGSGRRLGFTQAVPPQRGEDFGPGIAAGDFRQHRQRFVEAGRRIDAVPAPLRQDGRRCAKGELPQCLHQRWGFLRFLTVGGREGWASITVLVPCPLIGPGGRGGSGSGGGLGRPCARRSAPRSRKRRRKGSQPAARPAPGKGETPDRGRRL